MQLRWSVILPVIGLLLFTAVTIRSARFNDHDASHPHKYFWWSSLRLDTDPLNRHPTLSTPCADNTPNCTSWELRAQWITPALLDRVLIYSAFPAFLAGAAVIIGLNKFGVDEVLSFMVSMPIFLFGWYFLVGWLIERAVFRRQRRKRVPLSLL
jgi:hypothetical protein